MHPLSKVYIAGHSGMVGSAILRLLTTNGYSQIIVRNSSELDLRDQSAVRDFFASEKPDYVFLAAARVGGILANNTYRGRFIYDNLMIETNVIEAARIYGVQKLLFLGSSCIYPKEAPQPLKEEYLLSGYLEHTNQPYAIAKIAGIEMCNAYRQQYGCNFISVMPTNLYGPNDNYNLDTSHVLPALIRKIHEAKKNNAPEVTIWGSGRPRREFLHADDLANACVFLMNTYDEPDIINVGVGEDISILELAHLIKQIIRYDGQIKHDYSKPDGTLRKVLDVSKLKKIGWLPSISLENGIRRVYEELGVQPWY